MITIEKFSDIYRKAVDLKLVILVRHLSILTRFCPVSCCYHKPCAHTNTTFQKHQFVRIDGHCTAEERQGSCDRFQFDDKYLVAVLSITAAGTGMERVNLPS